MASDAPPAQEDLCSLMHELDDTAIAKMCEAQRFRKNLEAHRGCGLCTGRIFVILPPPRDTLCWVLAQWNDDQLEVMFSNVRLGNEVMEHVDCGRCRERIWRLRYRWEQKVQCGEAPRFSTKDLDRLMWPQDE